MTEYIKNPLSGKLRGVTYEDGKIIDVHIRDTDDVVKVFVPLDNGVTVQELDGCKYCKEYEDLPEHFIDGEPVGRVFDTCIQPNENGLWHIEVPCGADIGIRFCPMCGRKLPQTPKGE